MRAAVAPRWIGPIAAMALLVGCASAPAPRAADAGRAVEPAAGRADPRAPLRDLDVLPKQVPPLLLDALAYPYTPPAPLDCPTLVARVRELDAVLGADLDDPRRPPPNDHTAARLLVGGVRSAIPYFGWLRRVTGADRRQRLAEAAFAAGNARRGYLKGLGGQLACAPPAAPMPPPTGVAR